MDVTQKWMHSLPMMQQTVLLTAIRGPDGIGKYGPVKMLLRWFRRCVLVSAMDGEVLTNPLDPRGGSFTGPSISPEDSTHWTESMNKHVAEYLKQQDELPFHFQMHFMHAIEILGYEHPDPAIRFWWFRVYVRLVNAMHLHIETREELNDRLSDSRSGWLRRADPATVE